MPSSENISAVDDRAETDEELARLRQQLATALEMLQIMQEELQAAHDALAAMRPHGITPPHSD